jgi:outer membrane protein TolC
LAACAAAPPPVASAQSASDSPPSSSASRGAQEQSVLASLVSELERRNPELAATRREIDMRIARVAPAGAPADPALSFGYMSGFLRAPFFPGADTPDGFRQIGVTQSIPYPGKLALRSNIASIEVEAARWASEDTRARLIADLKRAYVTFVLAARTLDILQANKAEIEHVRGIAESLFSVGKASQQDVLRAQLELSILLERIASLELDRTIAQADINRLLYRPAATPVPVTDPAEAGAVPPAETLQQLAAARTPALRRDEQFIHRGQLALELARKELRPDFAIAVTTQKRGGGTPWMYGVDFMIDLPIFWQRKQRPMVAEAFASLEAARRIRERTLSEAETQVAQEVAAIATSRRLMELYTDSVLPQARLVVESSTAAYQVGSVDFLTLLGNVITLRDYQIALLGQRARYLQALARLEPLVAMELLR